VDSDQIISLDEVTGSDMPSFELAILSSPLTIDRLATSSRTVAQIHDYTLVVPGEPVSVERIPLPQPWAPIREDQFLAVNQDGTIHFAFSSPPSGAMDAVGVRASIGTAPGYCYILSADIQDWYNGSSPTWGILQQLIVNDVVLWSHDVAGTGDCWQRLDHYLMATGTELNIELAAIAPSGALWPLDWPSVSLTGISDLRIRGCQ
jgi:hypothetical protein